ncbi:Bacterial TniB protein [Corynebacterium atrinae]|uniref:TniB family NTP-binding protein n=1 Tax=Corynebacterium atrinae TaxID=1336740 RepID=UPI0025B4CD84|nr:TniB family NTP-binding protein [Corynebacterium atrinae]WJY64173.1 Bacterial TniB protein [Corynebacterium atrinae]
MVSTAHHHPLDLAHLHPDVHASAGLPAAERISRIRADRWIGYPKAVEAVDRLETLLAWPRKQRMPNLLLVGPTNNGKSMIIEQFRRRHLPVTEADREHIPVVSMQMPSEPSPLRFYTAILTALGAPVGPRRRLVDLEQLVLRLLREVGAKILIIDELHNILAGRGDTRREFLNLLRFLGNELRIPIVGVGTREAYLAVRSDDQLENRFEPFILPAWEAGEQTRSLLASFAASFPLRRRSVLDTEDMMTYLLARSEGTIGELAHLLTLAAVAAVDSGVEAINQKTLAMTDYVGPTQRRRLFERELL